MRHTHLTNCTTPQRKLYNERGTSTIIKTGFMAILCDNSECMYTRSFSKESKFAVLKKGGKFFA